MSSVLFAAFVTYSGNFSFSLNISGLYVLDFFNALLPEVTHEFLLGEELAPHITPQKLTISYDL
jgi:hypothetical protein